MFSSGIKSSLESVMRLHAYLCQHDVMKFTSITGTMRYCYYQTADSFFGELGVSIGRLLQNSVAALITEEKWYLQ